MLWISDSLEGKTIYDFYFILLVDGLMSNLSLQSVKWMVFTICNYKLEKKKKIIQFLFFDVQNSTKLESEMVLCR